MHSLSFPLYTKQTTTVGPVLTGVVMIIVYVYWQIAENNSITPTNDKLAT